MSFRMNELKKSILFIFRNGGSMFILIVMIKKRDKQVFNPLNIMRF